MSKTKRKILVTTALPYANGPLHLGHLVEQIQADIWVRFQKMRGHQCWFLSGDDAHGTPIMLQAEKKGIAPETLVADIHQSHLADSNGFLIDFDNYYSTHSSENKELSEMIYQRIFDHGDIEQREVELAYDTQKEMFLPDRYVKGDCPRCNTSDQYGDSCESCGATYSPADLKNPVSVISNTTPIRKKSEHLFFKLDLYEEKLKAWLQAAKVQDQVRNKLEEWFEHGLRQWNISRDAPYFGFEIPNFPGKYFYVWLDAPIGYMASLKNLCARDTSVTFDAVWNQDSDIEVCHFIGKDIIYFHTLFWPAILMSAGLRTPSAVFSHGFLTVDGKKMSKSRGTFISAQKYLEHLNPEYLRYYFAAKLSGRIDDIDLNLDDFTARINADLVGKVINIASRCAGFLRKQFNNTLSDTLSEPDLYNEGIATSESVADAYEHLNFAEAMRDIMAFADRVNQYIEQQKPWVVAKENPGAQSIQDACSMGIHLFRLLAIMLKPVLPDMAQHIETFLNVKPLAWEDINTPLLGHTINKFKPLMQRIEPEQAAQLIE